MGTDEQQPRSVQILIRIGAVVGALSTIVAAFFLFFPRLKPPEPLQKRAVALSDLQVRLQKYGDSAVVIFFKAQIDGYQGTTLPVMWTLYDADTGVPVDTWPLLPPTLGFTVRHKGSPTSDFTPHVPSESFIGEIHIPERPPKLDPPRTWRVTLEVVDPVGNRLAQADTERFSVAEPFSRRP